MEFDDLLANFRSPTQQELKFSERVAAYNSGDMSKVALIDKYEEEYRKQKAYHCSIHKYRANLSRAALSRETYLSLTVFFRLDK